MNFEESVKYLYSLGNEVTAMKLGLENPRKLLQSLDNPHENYLKIQVAGTNGKGSTCAFLDSICRQANIKTGLFTSPHLISITERIKINGEEISEADFAKYATIVKSRVESQESRISATFFEQITMIALLAFAENNVDLAILETGLGGRLDATTAANAEIVAITPIDYDHQQYLGETLTEIAGEKAAIINSPKQKVVISKQHAESEKVILERCKEFGVKPIKNCRLIEENSNENFLVTKKQVYLSNLSLKGKHQFDNASVAIDLAETLAENFGFTIGIDEIDKGLQTATHKGRLEFYKHILFDGSHNIAGAKALREYLREEISQPITLIFGAMKDKQIAEIAEILFPLADVLILTEVENSRTAKVEDLHQFAQNQANVILTQNTNEALEIARMFPENLTCVTGSLYLVGETQKLLG
ncbi:MAG: bifunctional folylpolyglutamate synthase/dihydrofolate synthase [Pyrinomonadaceae bacterium]|jgi:dihydrofolate synthase/folylpolyglutamate synthase|nr:bifunctional folylpolyglutamate synthase/dihydrofolate synthase [Pyrinomonadaceae bacterium]